MNNNDQWNILIERLYKVEEGNKGLTTRVRLLEAELDKIKEQERKRL
jgi:hypothetical protein